MTDLERSSLLGDYEAQKGLASLGKLSSCPWCGGEMQVCHGDNYGYYKTKCILCGAESPEQKNEWYAMLRNNVRPAPPIGRCGECEYKPLCINYDCMKDDNGFCKWFKPKED